MIIDNFHVVRSSVSPAETDSPLTVDPDAVLSLSIASKSFKLITGRDRQFRQSCCSIEEREFLERRHPNF